NPPKRCGNAGREVEVENSRLALWVTPVRHRVSHRHLPPLEIANRAIPTFPQRRPRTYLFQSRTRNQAHALLALGLEEFTKGDSCRFSPSSVSGSSCIGIKCRFQYHSSIGKCSRERNYGGCDRSGDRGASRDWAGVVGVRLYPMSLL